MQAIRFHEFGDKEVLKQEQVPIPAITDDEVLIQVEACGVNRADILYRTGKIQGKLGLPHIPGTEVAGVIAEVAADTSPFQFGDRVFVYPNFYCGTCEDCLHGDDNICKYGEVFGFDTDGGYAEYVKAPAPYVIRIPENLASVDAATFSATAATSWHMLKKRANLQAGETILIVAAGSGIGVYAIQIAKFLGAKIIATAGSEEKRAKAKELGADIVIDHREKDWYKQVKQMTDGKGVDVVFEHVGQATWNESIRTLGRKARLVTCGAFTGSNVELDLWPLFAKEISLIGSFSASHQDYKDVLQLASDGIIKPVRHAELRLEEAAKAHELLENRHVFGTLVINPQKGRG